MFHDFEYTMDDACDAFNDELAPNVDQAVLGVTYDVRDGYKGDWTNPPENPTPIGIRVTYATLTIHGKERMADAEELAQLVAYLDRHNRILERAADLHLESH